jgi:hypothetical protein
VCFPLVCLSLECPLGWLAGTSSIHSRRVARPTPLGLANQGPPKVLHMCSRLLGRLPSVETPGVSPLGCALLAVRACLLVLLRCAHPTKFLKRYLPYPILMSYNPVLMSYILSDTRVPQEFLVCRSSNQPGMMYIPLLSSLIFGDKKSWFIGANG